MQTIISRPRRPSPRKSPCMLLFFFGISCEDGVESARNWWMCGCWEAVARGAKDNLPLRVPPLRCAMQFAARKLGVREGEEAGKEFSAAESRSLRGGNGTALGTQTSSTNSSTALATTSSASPVSGGVFSLLQETTVSGCGWRSGCRPSRPSTRSPTTSRLAPSKASRHRNGVKRFS